VDLILGANARHLVGACVEDRIAVAFPSGTLIVNVTGSVVMDSSRP
jgi:fluoride ion exporter CrcB/FEX